MLTMEFASRLRWILVISVMIIVLILVGWGLFTIASNIFRGDQSQPETTSETINQVESTAVASYKVEGPVVANEDHRSYTIVVSENVVTMKTFSNYDKTLIAEKNYTNTPAAYESFLSALSNANVTALARNTSTEFSFEDQGVCATGRKFFLELDTSLFRWSTSCSNKQGNAGFNMAPVSSLFQRQVPDFSDMTRGLGL
jgi:hypothetical protein